MKKLLITLAATLSTFSLASAQIFNPDFTSGSTPAGYTFVSNNGGTATYSGGVMHTGDDSVNQSQAYITANSTAAEGNNSLHTVLTFSSTYQANGDGAIRTYSDFPVLSLYSANSNNPILEVDLLSSGYGPNAQVNIGQGIAYGGASTTGASGLNSSGLNSLSGVPITVDVTTTFLNLGVDPMNSHNDLWQFTNIGTVTAGSMTAPIDLVSTGSADAGNGTPDSGWNPINNSLTLQLGTTAGYFSGGAGNGGDMSGFLTGPASVDISSLDISLAVPEPSVCALMLGGLAVLSLVSRQRKTA